MKPKFTTHEQLFALCVLLNWKAGLSVGGFGGANNEPFVVLCRRPHSNEGNGITLMFTETNAENCAVRLGAFAQDPKVVEFEVLGYPLQVSFDDTGTGAVTYRE